MKKILYFATAALALSACTSEEYVGIEKNETNAAEQGIRFASNLPAMTRANQTGAVAATTLGNNFIVEGTKGTLPATTPTTSVVFDNYLVKYVENTADKTESNTNNWEYVNVETAGTTHVTNTVWSALHAGTDEAKMQDIKYWDYSQPQYDFIAYSTGTCDMVTSTPSNGQVQVTRIATGANLATSAYQFTVNRVEDLEQIYITDVTPVLKSAYGQPVQLIFKNMSSRIRVALYETIPGYSVKDVKFYADGSSTTNGTDAILFASSSILPASGTVTVKYPHTGTDNASAADKNMAQVSVTAGSTKAANMNFGTLNASTLEGKDRFEEDATQYLGRASNDPTFAGTAAPYYKAVMPNNVGNALTLRCDYTLVSRDGSGETITVSGATAVVPATYTAWQPNYAYTYIFKISDNTNGKTDGLTGSHEGLHPITFDAVVAEMTDATAEQTTITTVATPSITTYQKGHKYDDGNEYTTANGDIYVMVMSEGTPKANLNTAGQLYSITGATTLVPATEANVMDALTYQASVDGDGNITGRNGLVLTKVSTATAQTAIPGVDGNNVTVATNSSAKFTPTASTNYAYVYTMTAADPSNNTNKWEAVTVKTGDSIEGLYDAIDGTVQTGTAAADGTYYDKYVMNDGVYATKVIKVQ